MEMAKIQTEISIIIISYMKNEIRWIKTWTNKALKKTLKRRKETNEWVKGYFTGYEECLAELEKHLNKLEKKSKKIKRKNTK